MKVAVIEDDQTNREKLAAQLRRYAAERNAALDVSCFASVESFLFGYHFDCDLALLDIAMSGTDGIEGARMLRKIDEAIVFIFTTSLARYVTAGYKLGAADYLIKPIRYSSLAFSLDRVRRDMEEGKEPYIILNSRASHYRVKFSSILYAEVSDHRLQVHRENDVIDVWGSLGDIESRLAQAEGLPQKCWFARCTSGLLVNLAHVRAVRGSEIALLNGKVLPLSRSKKRGFLDAVRAYVERER